MELGVYIFRSFVNRVGLVGLEKLRRKVRKLTKRVTTLESAQAGVSG